MSGPDATGTDVTATDARWAEVAARVRAAQRVALVTHRRPDGDALGCVLALARALTALGKEPDVMLVGPIETSLLGLVGDTPYRLVDTAPESDSYDLIVVADTGAWSQLEPLDPWLRRHHDTVVCLDHHPRSDDVGALRIIDTSAAAATELIARLLDELGCDLGRGAGSAAEALFVGLATDTGWFRFPNATAATFHLAGRLLDRDVDHAGLYRAIEETQRPERLALEARALGGIVYARDGQVAIVSLGLDDFRETGAGLDELTALVNRPMAVGRVRVSLLICEVEPGVTKVSLRAKPAPEGVDDDLADVNRIARRLGGGGHRFAAGARLPVGLAEARARVLEALASTDG